MTPSTSTALNNSRALARVGAYLDAMESGRTPCLAQGYRSMARVAEELLATNRECPFMREVVALSPALKELRSNYGMALAIQVGLLQLPRVIQEAMLPRSRT